MSILTKGTHKATIKYYVEGYDSKKNNKKVTLGKVKNTLAITGDRGISFPMQPKTIDYVFNEDFMIETFVMKVDDALFPQMNRAMFMRKGDSITVNTGELEFRNG